MKVYRTSAFGWCAVGIVFACGTMASSSFGRNTDSAKLVKSKAVLAVVIIVVRQMHIAVISSGVAESCIPSNCVRENHIMEGYGSPIPIVCRDIR